MFSGLNSAGLLRYLFKTILLATVYFISARIGLSISPVSGFATLVWPPAGIALAVLFLWGRSLWPGIFIGALLVNFITGAPLLVAAGIGAGNTLEAIAGSSLLKHFGFQTKLNRVFDVVLLVGLGALLSTLISAVVGTSSLFLGGTIEAAAYPKTWLAWWIGDMLGTLLIATFIFTWVADRKIWPTFKQLIELLVLSGLFLTSAIFIFGNSLAGTPFLGSPPYLLFPFLIWAALRFRVRIITAIHILLAAITVHAAISNVGPFAGSQLDERLFSSQLFIGVSAVTFLAFSATMAERKQAQLTLHDLNKKLEKTLNKRTIQLRKEKEIERLKDEFVAVASHELKTPITTIKAFADLLDSKLSKSKDKEAASLAASIGLQTNKLTLLINGLLDVSRIDAGKFIMHKTKVNLDTLLKKTVADFQHTTPKHQIVYKTKVLPRISADPNALEQVILNLLSNAVKYSPQSDKVVVRARTTSGKAFVSVQDFGSGIAEKDMVKIFDRFYRIADNAKQKQAVSGIGLGLFVAASIIEQHGGKLRVESRLGKGSTFRFSLPLK